MSIPSSSSTAEDRPVPLRMRPDLSVQRAFHNGRHNWNIKDPAALRYFQLRDEEYAILSMLNGRSSLRSIQRQFEERFAPRRVSLAQLQGFLGMLHREGLLLADAGHQADYLWEWHQETSRQRWRNVLLNPLAICFRGVDPDRLLRWLLPRCRPLFSHTFLTVCGLLVLSALLLVVVHCETLQRRLPDLHMFLTASNLVLLAVVLSITKALHELGHGLTCKHFGGECHEMGLMLLAFTPCLYCNVSDAWMLPSRSSRIAVSAAGIVVEVVLAALCTFLWWFSAPGPFNTLCLNVMLVCSVSTILFNGNPLLRYDGYYILADWLDQPNLRQQATALVQHGLSRWFCGLEQTNRRLLPERRRGWIALFGVASVLYRWFVIVMILWFVHSVLKPHGLTVLSGFLAVGVLGTLVVHPVVGAVTFVRDPIRSRQVKWRQLKLRSVFVAAGCVAALLLPLPCHVRAPAVVAPRQATAVYVSLTGRLIDSVQPGDEVAEGQVLARLENLDVRMAVEKLQGARDRLERQVDNLERQRVSDPAASATLPTVRRQLADVEDRLAQRRADQRRLTLTAPVSGTVLSAPNRTVPAASDELTGWRGTPLDPQNRGCTLEAGTALCWIGDPGRCEAVVAVGQEDIETVALGQVVRLKWDALPGTTLEGTVTEIAAIDLRVTPRELVPHQDLPQRTDAAGRRRPAKTSYQMRVAFESQDDRLLIGNQGRAKIRVAPQSFANRLYRLVSHTFRIEL